MGNVFKPKRGLRQGNSIYPYFFILCAEELSVLLPKAEKFKKIKVVCIVRGAPPINHMFFENDSSLFGWANFNEWIQIQSLLGIYAEASRQILNHQKSSIFFNSNTNRATTN